MTLWSLGWPLVLSLHSAVGQRAEAGRGGGGEGGPNRYAGALSPRGPVLAVAQLLYLRLRVPPGDPPLQLHVHTQLLLASPVVNGPPFGPPGLRMDGSPLSLVPACVIHSGGSLVLPVTFMISLFIASPHLPHRRVASASCRNPDEYAISVPLGFNHHHLAMTSNHCHPIYFQLPHASLKDCIFLKLSNAHAADYTRVLHPPPPAPPTARFNPFLGSCFHERQPSTHLHNLENWHLPTIPRALSPITVQPGSMPCVTLKSVAAWPRAWLPLQFSMHPHYGAQEALLSLTRQAVTNLRRTPTCPGHQEVRGLNGRLKFKREMRRTEPDSLPRVSEAPKHFNQPHTCVLLRINLIHQSCFYFT